jgi:hypothetical protein
MKIRAWATAALTAFFGTQSAVAQVQVALSIFLVLLVVQVVAQVLLVRHVQ